MAVAISLVPFLVIELALRRFAPAQASIASADQLVDLSEQPSLFRLNRDTQRWEIPQQRMNFFRPASFAAEKPSGLRRIFVLGGSTVQGRPFSTETSFASWLLLRLQAAEPETQFEVINCGGVSYASYRVAIILDEILGHQPDAIVIYTGHNEFLEDREYASLREAGEAKKWLWRTAAHFRTVTWLREKLKDPIDPIESLAGEVDARLDHAGGLDRYKRDRAWRTGVELHFAQTLSRMIERIGQAEVPLVLCVPAGDLVNTPPFKVESDPELKPAPLQEIERAWSVAFDQEAPFGDRLTAAATALALDPRHAGANYVAGRLNFEQGRADDAGRYLRAARDFDVCPLRATSTIIDSVHELASRYDVALVRTEELLDQRDYRGQRAPDGIPDPEFFLDHVHPTIAGHQLIGAELARKFRELELVEENPEAESRYYQAAEQYLAQFGEEYYARGLQRLEGLRRWAAGRAGETDQPRIDQ